LVEIRWPEIILIAVYLKELLAIFIFTTFIFTVFKINWIKLEEVRFFKVIINQKS